MPIKYQIARALLARPELDRIDVRYHWLRANIGTVEELGRVAASMRGCWRSARRLGLRLTEPEWARLARAFTQVHREFSGITNQNQRKNTV